MRLSYVKTLSGTAEPEVGDAGMLESGSACDHTEKLPEQKNAKFRYRLRAARCYIRRKALRTSIHACAARILSLERCYTCVDIMMHLD